MLKKSDAARAMLKKKLDIYEARQKNNANTQRHPNVNYQDADSGGLPEIRSASNQRAFQVGGVFSGESM